MVDQNFGKQENFKISRFRSLNDYLDSPDADVIEIPE